MELKELFQKYINTGMDIGWYQYCMLSLISDKEVELLQKASDIYIHPFKELEDKSYIKEVEGEYFLLKKGLELFPEKEDREFTFEIFWNKYHEITSLSKTDKDAAEKYWRRLKNKEKKLAISNIENYWNSLNEKKYCKKARTYLADKNFNDEFKTKTQTTSTFIG